jgi:hypothetical protein
MRPFSGHSVENRGEWAWRAICGATEDIRRLGIGGVGGLERGGQAKRQDDRGGA